MLEDDMARTTIILKEPIAKRVRELARTEDRRLSNMIGLLIAEALEEREKASRRVQHLGSVLTKLRQIAPPEAHRRSAGRLRKELDA
jgi:hypothetical protein